MMRPMVRTLFLLAVGCSMALPVSLPLAGSAGRDYSRCVHACNAARQSCDDRCGSDCATLYPNDANLRRVCESTCHGICVDQEGDCKDICLAFKKGEVSDEEP